MARVRVHQHVNPLAPYFRFEPKPIVLSEVFTSPEKPLFLDLGCARGRFILQMAEADDTQNFLGLEIREPLVHEANRIAKEAGLSNLHYEFSNALLSLDKSLELIPAGILKTVAIQFSDPWFKKKHAKRRMVTPELARTVIDHLAPDGAIVIQTDIDFLAEEMFDIFRRAGGVKEYPLDDSPFPFKTEREAAVESKNLPVYRTSFRKSSDSE